MWSIKIFAWSVSGLREKISLLRMSKPPLVHLFQKLPGDGIAGGIAEDGVGVAIRAEGCGLLTRGIVGHLCGREDAAAEEATALLRPLYLITVAETGFVDLFEL